MDRFRVGMGDAAGAVADLGVLVPLAATLVLVNGLDPGAVLVWAGMLAVSSGAAFRVPFPVQPLKALTAVAVTRTLPPAVIHAAGLEIGALLLLLSFKGIADRLARLFTKPVIRSLQFGVGCLLVLAAARLVLRPPQMFRGTPPSPWPVLLAVGAFAAVGWTARRRRYGLALGLLATGVAVAWGAARPQLGGPALTLPHLDLPPAAAFLSAFGLLVVPQVPLTFGNAVVAVSDLAHGYFGPAARRVTPSRVCLSSGLGNLASALFGGMPMCHGAGGLTAHRRLGAESAGMNLILGGALILLGLLFAPQVPQILGLLPVWALAAFLAYAGLRHALLVKDLERGSLALAVGAGALGAVTGNLALSAGLALAVEHGRALRLRIRARSERSP